MKAEARDYDLDLPALPALPAVPTGVGAHVSKCQRISGSQFTRKKLQGLLHIMTAELKIRGTKTPHILLPFRSRVDDTKVELFLRRVFPNGELIDTSKKAIVRSILDDFDEFTLICGMKYLWCRLPNNEIIGWPVYLEFKRKEHDAGYPKDAFLTIMPKCLSSSSHASIVYDFLDLMISIASNSPHNHLSGRKIAKMASIWAFKNTPTSSSAFYDATLQHEASFPEGLETWKEMCNGLFHLLLSFLRAMLPESEADTLNLPKTLQSLLITSSYPPPDDNSPTQSMITIPCVHVRSTRKSSDPYELISKVRHSLSFEKRDSFLSIENYTILKNIFQKSSTAEVVSTLSDESRRILSRLTDDPLPSIFDLYPGWTRDPIPPQDPDIPLYTEVNIDLVSLQDYYIWTWLSTLGSDQTSSVKSLFGRSIVVEAGLRGFQKWLVLTETTMDPDEYISIFQDTNRSTHVEHYSRSPQISPLPKNFGETPILSNVSLPPSSIKLDPPLPHQPQPQRQPSVKLQVQVPPPPPPKNDPLPPTPEDTPLPSLDFTNDHFSYEDGDFAGYNQYEPSPSPEYGDDLSHGFSDKVVISNKPVNRPRPPPLEGVDLNLKGPRPKFEASRLPLQAAQINLPEPNNNQEAPRPPAKDWNLQEDIQSHSSGYEKLFSYEEERPRQEYPQNTYQEPFETYTTPYDRKERRVPSEPFENYHIPGIKEDIDLKPTKDVIPSNPTDARYGDKRELPPIDVTSGTHIQGQGFSSQHDELNQMPVREQDLYANASKNISYSQADRSNEVSTGSGRNPYTHISIEDQSRIDEPPTSLNKDPYAPNANREELTERVPTTRDRLNETRLHPDQDPYAQIRTGNDRSPVLDHDQYTHYEHPDDLEMEAPRRYDVSHEKTPMPPQDQGRDPYARIDDRDESVPPRRDRLNETRPEPGQGTYGYFEKGDDLRDGAHLKYDQSNERSAVPRQGSPARIEGENEFKTEASTRYGRSNEMSTFQYPYARMDSGDASRDGAPLRHDIMTENRPDPNQDPFVLVDNRDEPRNGPISKVRDQDTYARIQNTDTSRAEASYKQDRSNEMMDLAKQESPTRIHKTDEWKNGSSDYNEDIYEQYYLESPVKAAETSGSVSYPYQVDTEPLFYNKDSKPDIQGFSDRPIAHSADHHENSERKKKKKKKRDSKKKELEEMMMKMPNAPPPFLATVITPSDDHANQTNEQDEQVYYEQNGKSNTGYSAFAPSSQSGIDYNNSSMHTAQSYSRDGIRSHGAEEQRNSKENKEMRAVYPEVALPHPQLTQAHGLSHVSSQNHGSNMQPDPYEFRPQSSRCNENSSGADPNISFYPQQSGQSGDDYMYSNQSGHMPRDQKQQAPDTFRQAQSQPSHGPVDMGDPSHSDGSRENMARYSSSTLSQHYRSAPGSSQRRSPTRPMRQGDVEASGSGSSRIDPGQSHQPRSIPSQNTHLQEMQSKPKVRHPIARHPMGHSPMAPNQMAPHPMAPHPMAPHPMAPNQMAPHPMAPHPMAPHPMAPHPMAPHPMAPNQMAPNQLAPHPIPGSKVPNYYPQQGNYPPPQAFGYPPQPGAYYPPPAGYYPPPPKSQPPGSRVVKVKPSTSELTMMNMPAANAFNKNVKTNKANLRAVLNQGFGL